MTASTDGFEECATLAGWSEEDCKYWLNMHLDKTAFHTHHMLPADTMVLYFLHCTSGSYLLILRSLEWQSYQVTQKDETVGNNYPNFGTKSVP